MQPASTNNDKKYFTFEGQLYYAIHNAPDYTGSMIFTAGGIAVEQYQFPELWMYYKYQKESGFAELKNFQKN